MCTHLDPWACNKDEHKRLAKKKSPSLVTKNYNPEIPKHCNFFTKFIKVFKNKVVLQNLKKTKEHQVEVQSETYGKTTTKYQKAKLNLLNIMDCEDANSFLGLLKAPWRFTDRTPVQTPVNISFRYSNSPAL